MPKQDELNKNAKLPQSFSYDDVLQQTNALLPDLSPAGKAYAALRFLQDYCRPHDAKFADFCDGSDPRKYAHLADLKTQASFSRLDAPPAAAAPQGEGPGFIEFLAAEIRDFNTPYRWPFKIRAKEAWLHGDFLQGETLDDAASTLAVCENQLKNALDNTDHDGVFQAVRSIMDWGGVYYPQGPRSMNEQSIVALWEERQLTREVADNIRAIGAASWSEVTRMNSAWTKVWAVLRPQDFIILDDRVSFAVASIVGKYCDLHNLDRKAFAIRLGFAQVAHQPKRTANGIPVISKSHPGRWAEAMAATSLLLKEVIAHARHADLDIYGAYPQNLRGIEAKLFMMGA